MRSPTAVAPDAPPRTTGPVDPVAMTRYLAGLREWRTRRRAELDALDRAALASPEAASLTPDVTLAMALWQAVAARHDELERVWDGGRVGEVELRRLSALVWGRLDAAGSVASLAVSLPEACRLSDVLAGQLARRLALDPVDADAAAHVRALRAALERVRDLVAAEPSGPVRDGGAARLSRLDTRLRDVTERAGRGADVGGLVPSLEADVARVERDLIVAAATRRDDERDRDRAIALREELAARGAVVERLAVACVARVRDAPTLAVPRVEALGPVPEAAADVDAYLARLGAVARALDLAERAYGAPVAELDDLRGRLDAYRAKALATGRDAWPEVAGLYRGALAVVTSTPADLPRARAAVAAYQTLLTGGTA